MKNKSMKTLKSVFILTLALCACACACAFACTLTLSLVSCKATVPDNSETVIPSTIPDDKENSNDSQENIKNIEITYTLKYYDIIEDTTKEFTETKNFENEIEPEYFIQKLSELMNTTISVNSINFDGDKILIDFSSNSSPLGGTGSYEESCILESISAVFFDIYPEINEIHITADGKDYDSGHTMLPKDTPYATRQKQKVG